MSDMLICVDALDRPIGSADKLRCHREGLLHRAFSVFLVDGSRILLQRRALHKYHSGGLWANACCSHPRVGETLPDAVSRRLFEELGVQCDCREIGSFVYRHRFSPELYEYEYDHVFMGNYQGNVFPNQDEIMEVRWFETDELLTLMQEKPDMFASWFITALPMVLKIRYPR